MTSARSIAPFLLPMLVVLPTTGLAASVSAASAWRASPSATRVDGRPAAAIELSGGIGAVRTARLSIRNRGATELGVRISAVGARSANGRISHRRPDSVNDPARWIVRPESGSRRNIPPRTTVRLLVGVRLPSSATPGEHLAGLRVTAVDGGRRVEVPVRIRVDGATRTGLTLTRSQLLYERPNVDPTRRGTASYRWQARNTGNTVLMGDLVVRLDTLFGRKLPLDERRNVTVLPGDSLQGQAQVAAWPTFSFAPEVVIDRERQGPRGMRFQDEVGDRGVELAVVPVAQIGALVVAMLVAFAGWAVARRRRSDSTNRLEDAA